MANGDDTPNQPASSQWDPARIDAANKALEERIAKLKAIKEEEQALWVARMGQTETDALQVARERMRVMDEEIEGINESIQAYLDKIATLEKEDKAGRDAANAEIKRLRKLRKAKKDAYSEEEEWARKAAAAIKDHADALKESEDAGYDMMTGLLGVNQGLGSFISKMAGTKGGFTNFTKGIFRALKPLNLLQSIFTKVIESTIKVAAEGDEAVASFKKATGASRELGEQLRQQAYDMRATGVSADELGSTYQALYTSAVDFVKASPAQQKSLTSTAALLGELGISADTSANIVQEASKSLGYGFGEVEGVLLEVAGTAEGLGRPFGLVARDFETVSKKLAFYGKNVMGTFKKLSQQSASTGLSVDQLLGVVEQFDTFEGAGRAVGKLNAIMGGPYLNSIDMLNASEEERVEILKRSMKQAGMNFAEMGKYEQKMIASSLGVGVDEARKLFGAETEQQKLEAMKKAELAAKAKDAQSLREKMAQAMDAMAIDISAYLPMIHDAITQVTEKIVALISWFNNQSTIAKGAIIAGTVAGGAALQYGGKKAAKAAGRGIMTRLGFAAPQQAASAATKGPGLLARMRGVTGQSGSFVRGGKAFSTKTGKALHGAASQAALAKHAKSGGGWAKTMSKAGPFIKFFGFVAAAIEGLTLVFRISKRNEAVSAGLMTKAEALGKSATDTIGTIIKFAGWIISFPGMILGMIGTFIAKKLGMIPEIQGSLSDQFYEIFRNFDLAGQWKQFFKEFITGMLTMFLPDSLSTTLIDKLGLDREQKGPSEAEAIAAAKARRAEREKEAASKHMRKKRVSFTDEEGSHITAKKPRPKRPKPASMETELKTMGFGEAARKKPRALSDAEKERVYNEGGNPYPSLGNRGRMVYEKRKRIHQDARAQSATKPAEKKAAAKPETVTIGGVEKEVASSEKRYEINGREVSKEEYDEAMNVFEQMRPKNLSRPRGVDDFIYNGTIVPIDKKDGPIAFGKPGGGIDDMLQKLGNLGSSTGAGKMMNKLVEQVSSMAQGGGTPQEVVNEIAVYVGNKPVDARVVEVLKKGASPFV